MLQSMPKKPDRQEQKPPKQERTLKNSLRAAGVAALGTGLGYMTADYMFLKSRALQEAVKHPSSGGETATKVLLPILGGAAFMLANRYRTKVDEASRGK